MYLATIAGGVDKCGSSLVDYVGLWLVGSTKELSQHRKGYEHGRYSRTVMSHATRLINSIPNLFCTYLILMLV